jgi:hypothetical protein
MFGRLEQDALREMIAERPKMLVRMDELEAEVRELRALVTPLDSGSLPPPQQPKTERRRGRA